MISEVYRVLNHGGKYICISFGDSEHRMKFFKSQNWVNINYEKIIKPFARNENNTEGLDFNNYHFVYIMTKA
jgi:ubiquinone/menaquinone biosynthesis C-methylase UbiE